MPNNQISEAGHWAKVRNALGSMVGFAFGLLFLFAFALAIATVLLEIGYIAADSFCIVGDLLSGGDGGQCSPGRPTERERLLWAPACIPLIVLLMRLGD